MKLISCFVSLGKQPNSIIFRTINRFDSTQPSTPQDLKKDVVNLYKNLIYLSREWPTDLRPKIKQAFLKNRDVQDPVEIRKLIERGEYVSREITATYHLRKYRAMKRRYYSDTREKELEDMFKSLSY